MQNDPGNTLSLTDIIEQFRSAMAEQDIYIKSEIIPDGAFHRIYVEGDVRGSRNGFYQLHADFPPNGFFGCNKRYGSEHKFKWKPDLKSTPMTPEAKKAFAEQVEKNRLEREAKRKAVEAAAAARANEIWNASEPAPDNHPYLVSKGVRSHGLRIGKWAKVDATGNESLVSDKALLIPLHGKNRNDIFSLQGIFPSKNNFLKRNKDYLTDGAKRGLFFAIGKPLVHDGKPVFVLCEGYATGATIHETTGHLVLVCFDAGNLKVVAQAIHESMAEQGKQVVIIIAADNDQWTTQPVKNPGVYHGKEAAKAVHGLLAVPVFSQETLDANIEDLGDGKLKGPTDFNDLALLEGNEKVVAAFEEALNPTLDEEDLPWDDGVPDTLPEAPNMPSPPGDDEHEDELVSNAYFTILGYDGGNYYLFQHEKRQVMDFKKGDFSETGLIELAPINWWEENFPGKEGMNRKQALNWIFRQANARGIYDPTRVRGRGAWKDKDRYVFHHGDMLTVDGVATDITRISSAYVYPMARRMPEPAEQMLTAEEGRHLLEVSKMIRWSMPASAPLFAGWVMLAPICGALKWRPHIWLTGAAGSGKSTIQRDFASSLTKDICVYAQGNSTEPGIRQHLRADARPVLLDEAESNDDKERARMESILAMIRQSSSESQAQTLKGTISGTSMNFAIRSMFCLASVNTNLDKKADIDRLTKLVIRSPDAFTPEEHWQKLSDELHKISTDETIANRLLARALHMLPTILKNVEVFTRAAAKKFGSQREGDQFGTMMAGAWSLCSDKEASLEAAAAMLDRYEWKEHFEDHDQDDAARAIEAVLGAKIRMGTFGDLTVYELIRECIPAYRLMDTLPQKEADAALKRHGIRVEPQDGVLLFGTSVSNLKSLVEKTSYVTDLRGQLLRVPGATRHDDKTMKFNGKGSKCVSIPLGPILDDEQGSDEPPI